MSRINNLVITRPNKPEELNSQHSRAIFQLTFNMLNQQLHSNNIVYFRNNYCVRVCAQNETVDSSNLSHVATRRVADNDSEMKRENLVRYADRAIFSVMPELLQKVHSHAHALLFLM